MKITSFVALASSITATAFAGSSKEIIPPAPAPAPSLGGWFIGGTYGQLSSVDSGITDLWGDIAEAEVDAPGESYDVDTFDFDFYSLHVGRDLGIQFLGCDVAAYLEVGYLTGDAQISLTSFNSMQQLSTNSLNFDLDIIPITMNVKLERSLIGSFSVYGTAGIGYAFSEITAFGDSERDGGFYAQASAGLLYNISQNVEAYAGARWLYLENVGIADTSGLEVENDFAWEIGLRYNF